jgi:glutaredoxin 2
MLTLFAYQQCPFCVRPRLALGLLNVPFNLKFITVDDADTPTKMIGAQMVPILEKEDGTFMGESLDIVKYLETKHGNVMDSTPAPEPIVSWLANNKMRIFQLTLPRFLQKHDVFPELATSAAREYYKTTREKNLFKKEGGFEEHFKHSQQYIDEISDSLAEIEHLFPGEAFGNGQNLSDLEMNIFPWLRNLTITKGVRWPPKIHKYLDFVSTQGKLALFHSYAI